MKPIFRKISALGAATLLLAVVALLACQDSSAARVVASA